MLVYYEMHETMGNAIRREKRLKKWNRAWKFRLIEQMNPEWNDLFDPRIGAIAFGSTDIGCNSDDATPILHLDRPARLTNQVQHPYYGCCYGTSLHST